MKGIIPILALSFATSMALAQNTILKVEAGGSLDGSSTARQQSARPGVMSEKTSGRDSASAPGAQPGQGTKVSETDRLINEALRHASQRNFTAAESELRQADALDKDNLTLLLAWTSVLADQSKYGEAREYTLRAMKLYPEDQAPAFNYGELFFMEKRYDEAQAAFEKLLQQQPQFQLVWLKLLLIGIMNHKPELIKDSIGRFENAGPSPYMYYARAAISFSQADLVGGKGWISRCFNDFGTGPVVYNLYKAFADLNWVNLADYPRNPAAR
jgi:tetratricopeptide (TPR) repeat protein